jgi:hypothetical protein
MTVCRECQATFDPVSEDEIMCWVCAVQAEAEYAAENGYLRSGYYADEFYVGDDNVGVYWGEVSDEREFPF